MRYFSSLIFLFCSLAACSAASAATYYVDGTVGSNGNPGTAAAPWQTINYAGSASVLKPGDTVLIKPGDTVLINSGVYRETVMVTVSGSPGLPITFAAAPAAQVVIKGSDSLSGAWSQDTAPGVPANVWEISVPASFFTQAQLGQVPPYLSTVYLNDTTSLQEIGQDSIYPASVLAPVGQGPTSLIPNSFYYDAGAQILYIDSDTFDPARTPCEIGDRGLAMLLWGVHDVTICGISMRQNRQPALQNPLLLVTAHCARVTVDNCRVTLADFAAVSVAVSNSVTVSNCELSGNGNTGLSLNQNNNCTVNKCVVNSNNTRHFNTSWVAGGIKAIPNNIQCCIENCEFGYNNGPGIWLDTDNSNCGVLSNICHHNQLSGIMDEVNSNQVGTGNNLIANNLVFSNGASGIFLSGDHSDTVLYNTLAENQFGLTMMPRGPSSQNNVQDDHSNLSENNLFLNDFIPGSAVNPQAEVLTTYQSLTGDQSDYNFYQSGSFSPNTQFPSTGGYAPFFRVDYFSSTIFSTWKNNYYFDTHAIVGSLLYTLRGTNFQITDAAAATKLKSGYPVTQAINGWTSTKPGQVGSTITTWTH